MRRLLPFGLAAFAAFAAACGGSGDGSIASGEGAFIEGETPALAQPQSLDDLQKLDSSKLKALFEDQTNRVQTMGMPLPNGPYDGIPLCRKDILPSTQELPPRIKDLNVHTGPLKLSDRLTNKLASKIWHGKEFTAGDGAAQGSVKNFIDVSSDGIQPTTKTSA